ncbi:MAG: DUF2339 domain-containing protein [Pseudomonadota bacterium]
MEGLIVLAVIMVVILPIVALIVGIRGSIKAGDAQKQIASLQKRIDALQDRIIDAERDVRRGGFAAVAQDGTGDAADSVEPRSPEDTGDQAESADVQRAAERFDTPTTSQAVDTPQDATKTGETDTDLTAEDAAPEVKTADEEAEEKPDPGAQEEASPQPWGVAARTDASSKPKPGAKKESGWIEALAGGQWAVWLGGVALALGGLFLVRYSIDAGLLGPGPRLVLATIFGLALLAGGEFLRRRPDGFSLEMAKRAYVPGVLTAAGGLTLFATIFSAHAVYSFIGPALAFVLLGIVALAIMAASLLHGPSMAALGLVGSFITPILVVSEKPNATALCVFLLIVTIAALRLARYRRWIWLVGLTATGAIFWAMGGATSIDVNVREAWAFEAYLVALSAIFSVLGVLWPNLSTSAPFGLTPASTPEFLGPWGAIPSDDDEEDEKEGDKEKEKQPLSRERVLARVLWCALGAMGIVLLVHSAGSRFSSGSQLVLALALFVMAVPALLSLRAPAGFVIAAATGTAAVSAWALYGVSISLDIFGRRMLTIAGAGVDGVPADLGRFATILSVAVLLVGLYAGRRWVTKSTPIALGWTAPMALVSPVTYSVCWIAGGGDGSTLFLILGLGAALALLVATDLLWRHDQRSGVAVSSQKPIAATAISSGLMLTLALGFNLFSPLLVLALAGAALAYALLFTYLRPITGIRYAAAVPAAGAVFFTVLEPGLALAVGTTPVINAYLFAYLAIIAAMFAAAWALGRTGEWRAFDAPQRFFEGAAVLFSALLITIEIRHYMHSGLVYAKEYSLAEQAGHTIAALVMSGALMRLDDKAPSPIFRYASMLAGLGSLAMVIFVHGIALNPLSTGEYLGDGRFFNLALVAYGIPAIVAAGAHYISRTRRPDFYVMALELTMWILLVNYLTIMVRHGWLGEDIGFNETPLVAPEAYMMTLCYLALIIIATFGKPVLFANWKSPLVPLGAVLSLGWLVVANLLVFQPWEDGVEVGHSHIFNWLLAGYLITAILLIVQRAKPDLPAIDKRFHGMIYGGLALIMVFLYATFTVRHIWHPNELAVGAFFPVEAYTYSAVWLAIGIALVVIAGMRNSRELRLASGAMVFAAVIKVFIFDMSALEGVLRALSFIGLGLVLIGIGLFYQRLLFSNQSEPPDDDPDDDPERVQQTSA